MSGLDGVQRWSEYVDGMVHSENGPWVLAVDAERAILEVARAVAGEMRRTCAALDEAIKLLASRDEAYRSGVRDCIEEVGRLHDLYVGHPEVQAPLLRAATALAALLDGTS